jgi:hypothetical protein
MAIIHGNSGTCNQEKDTEYQDEAANRGQAHQHAFAEPSTQVKPSLERRHVLQSSFLLFVDIKFFEVSKFSTEGIEVISFAEVVAYRIAEPRFVLLLSIIRVHGIVLSIVQPIDTILLGKSCRKKVC